VIRPLAKWEGHSETGTDKIDTNPKKVIFSCKYFGAKGHGLHRYRYRARKQAAHLCMRQPLAYARGSGTDLSWLDLDMFDSNLSDGRLLTRGSGTDLTWLDLDMFDSKR